MHTEIFFCELETETYVLLMEILGSKVYKYATTIVWLDFVHSWHWFFLSPASYDVWRCWYSWKPVFSIFIN